MAEFKNEKLGVRLVIPDRPTVRQQLAYFSEAGLAQGRELFERYWLAARALITEWECEACALDVDIDKADEPRIASVVLWAGMQVKIHMDALERIPKN